MEWRVQMVYFFAKLIKHPLFEAISLTVIVANTVTMALEDPTSST